MCTNHIEKIFRDGPSIFLQAVYTRTHYYLSILIEKSGKSGKPDEIRTNQDTLEKSGKNQESSVAATPTNRITIKITRS